MESNYTGLLAIHPLKYKGEQLFQKKWPDLIQSLKTMLRQSGIEAQDSSDDLLLLNYDHPFYALASYLESLELIKNKYDWQKKMGPLPLQVILHLEKKNEIPVGFRDPQSNIWTGLEHEIPFVTRSIKIQWDQLMAGKNLPPLNFIDSDSGLFQLKFSGEFKTQKQILFPYRYLVARGDFDECFYCGMHNHKPSECPSKHLSTEIRAIQRLGYLPIKEIASAFKSLFLEGSYKKYENILASGIDASQIRKDPLLLVFVSYLDVYMYYQPRYLWHVAFTIHPVWDGTASSTRKKVDSRNLQKGLDSLRVGHHQQSYDFMVAESQLLGGKQFYATIGQAFVSLERGRFDDVGQFLGLAKGLANSEKEKIYISLLLSRYFNLIGHAWKAEQTIQPLINLYLDCHEILYKKVQNLVFSGEGENGLKFLRQLTSSSKQMFISALFDPAFLPINGLVDNMLFSLIDIKNKEAGENLNQARNEIERLGAWFDGKDEDFDLNLNMFSTLEKQVERKSYFDLLDVAEKSKILTLGGPRLQESKLEKLNEVIDGIVINLDSYDKYWDGYPYKIFFKKFHSHLGIIKRKLIESRTVAAKSLGNANLRLAEAKGLLKGIHDKFLRMNKLKLAMDTFKLFLRKLVRYEILLTTLTFVFYPVVTILLKGFIHDVLGDQVFAFIMNPFVQKKSLFIITVLIAPFLAFANTIRALSK